MSLKKEVTMSGIIDLSRKVEKSLDHLAEIKKIPMDKSQRFIVSDLIQKAEDYLVFLEESARKIGQEETVDKNLFEPIQQHCQFIQESYEYYTRMF